MNRDAGDGTCSCYAGQKSNVSVSFVATVNICRHGSEIFTVCSIKKSISCNECVCISEISVYFNDPTSLRSVGGH